jgi:hypothetical protein
MNVDLDIQSKISPGTQELSDAERQRIRAALFEIQLSSLERRVGRNDERLRKLAWGQQDLQASLEQNEARSSHLEPLIEKRLIRLQQQSWQHEYWLGRLHPGPGDHSSSLEPKVCDHEKALARLEQLVHTEDRSSGLQQEGEVELRRLNQLAWRHQYWISILMPPHYQIKNHSRRQALWSADRLRHSELLMWRHEHRLRRLEHDSRPEDHLSKEQLEDLVDLEQQAWGPSSTRRSGLYGKVIPRRLKRVAQNHEERITRLQSLHA